SRHCPRHRIARESSLIRSLSIAGHLVKARMSADGGNLVGAAPGFREPPACRLAQPMRRAMLGQSGRVTPFPKALAEMVAAVWLAGRGDQKRQMLARRGVDRRL